MVPAAKLHMALIAARFSYVVLALMTSSHPLALGKVSSGPRSPEYELLQNDYFHDINPGTNNTKIPSHITTSTWSLSITEHVTQIDKQNTVLCVSLYGPQLKCMLGRIDCTKEIDWFIGPTYHCGQLEAGCLTSLV